MDNTYKSKAIVTRIVATSRAAVKIQDNYYTIEYQEERSIPDIEGIDLEQERILLFDEVNSVVDQQISDTIKAYAKTYVRK